MKVTLSDTSSDRCRKYFREAFEFVDLALCGDSSIEIQEVKKSEGDEQGTIEEINETFNKVKNEKNNRVLIHCSLGVSRSATFVIMYLMKKFGLPFEFVIT